MQTQVSSTSTGQRIASSDRVTTKAAGLAVAYVGHDVFAVASGRTPGRVYNVTADARDVDGATWGCTCDWAANGGAMCSHVRAAVRCFAIARRRAQRAAAARRKA